MERLEDFESILHVLSWYAGHEDFYKDVLKPVGTFLTKPWVTGSVSLLLGGLAVHRFGLPYLAMKRRREGYARAIKQAQERREKEIQNVKELLQHCKDDTKVNYVIKLILEGPMTVHSKLQDGSISPRHVVLAYFHYMIEAQEKTNCLTMILTDALEQAEALEKEYLGKPKPKLYGVLFSLKDMFDIEGRDSTVGLAKYLNQPKKRDCVLAKVLKHHGAIITAKTGCAQALFSFGSGNPIYGVVTNPNSSTRIAGGSSSGEGALLAMNGSMAGAGSDIGGSVRTPAHFCGICALKPVNGRLSAKDVLECVAGFRGVESTRGFMARDVEMLALCYSVALESTMFGLDPEVPPVAWRQDIYDSKGPLRIGFFKDDGFFTPTPGIKRAVELTVESLRSIGHTLVPFDNLDSWFLNHSTAKLHFQDRGLQILEQLEGEEIDPCITHVPNVTRILNGNFISKMLFFLSLKFSSATSYFAIQAMDSVKQPVDVMKTFAERDVYRTKFIEAWKSLELDALICPVFGIPAVAPDAPSKIGSAPTYIRSFNYVDFPAGVVPVTVESEADQEQLKSYRQDDPVYVKAKEAVEGAVGMPIGIQCVTLPFQEELALRVMRDIQNTAGRDMFMKPPLLATKL